MLQLNPRLQRAYGTVLFVFGLVGDCLVGMLLLTRGEWQLLLWHFPLALLWAVGVNLVTWQGESRESISFPYLNKWGLTALLLGAGTFPGFGSCAYSIAFFITRYLFSSAPIQGLALIEPELQAPYSLGNVPSVLDRVVQPLVDDLHEGDTEFRRAVVAKISHYAHPDTTQLLRQLLSDSKAEIRSDASLALTQLDDEMSRTLNVSFEAWNANPTDTGLTLTLVDQYYQYATSNVLDRKSQRFYLVQARDLLLQVITQEELEDAQLWLKLAHIRQRLGELSEALQDARRALQLQPDASEASLLAMELAFRTHSWDILISLARNEASALYPHPDKHAVLSSLQWWARLHPEFCGEARHE